MSIRQKQPKHQSRQKPIPITQPTKEHPGVEVFSAAQQFATLVPRVSGKDESNDVTAKARFMKMSPAQYPRVATHGPMRSSISNLRISSFQTKAPARIR